MAGDDIKFVQLDLDPSKNPLFLSHHDSDELKPDEVLARLNSTIQDLSVYYANDLHLGTIIVSAKIIETLLIRAYLVEFGEPPLTTNKDKSGDFIPKSVSKIRDELNKRIGLLSGATSSILDLIQVYRNIAAHGNLKISSRTDANTSETDAETVVKYTVDLVKRVICHYSPAETEMELIMLGKIRASFGNHDEAIKDFDSAISKNEDLAEAYYNRGLSRVALGKNEDAIKDFTQAIDRKWNLAANHFNRGKAREENGDSDGALEDFNTAINEDPNKYSEAYYRRGLLRVTSREYPQAIQDFDKAIDLKEDYAEAYYSRANVSYTSDEFASALADLDEAIRLNSDYTDAYRIRGKIKSKLELYQSAIADFDKALKANPSNDEILAECGHMKIGLKDNKAATDYFDRALRQNSNNVDAIIGLVGVNIDDHPQEARKHLIEVFRLDPHNAMGHYYDGCLAEMNKKDKQAIEAYTKAIDSQQLTKTYRLNAYTN